MPLILWNVLLRLFFLNCFSFNLKPQILAFKLNVLSSNISKNVNEGKFLKVVLLITRVDQLFPNFALFIF